MRITIREDFSMSMADQVMEDLHSSVEWLDTHFTVTKEQLTNLTKAVLGRKLSRMDSMVLSELTAGPSGSKVLKPC
jgi:hypothetical protein